MTADITPDVAGTEAGRIACTLPAEQHRARTGALAGLAERALRAREQTDHGERLTFDGSAEIERELRSAVAAEAACCAFLAMDLRRRDDVLVLEISGPPEARPIIAGLFAAALTAR